MENRKIDWILFGKVENFFGYLQFYPFSKSKLVFPRHAHRTFGFALYTMFIVLTGITFFYIFCRYLHEQIAQKKKDSKRFCFRPENLVLFLFFSSGNFIVFWAGTYTSSTYLLKNNFDGLRYKGSRSYFQPKMNFQEYFPMHTLYDHLNTPRTLEEKTALRSSTRNPTLIH